MRTISGYIIAILSLAAFCSCSLIDDKVCVDDTVSGITLSVSVPGGDVSTRGEGDWPASAAEKAVSHVDWLVYGSDGNLVQNVRTSDPTVTIPLGRGNYKVAAVANYPTEIPSAAVSSVSNYRTLLNVDYGVSAGASSPVLVMRSDVIDVSLSGDLSVTVPVKRVAVRVAILGDVRFTDAYKALFPSAADQTVRRIFLVNVPSKVGVYDGTMFGSAYVNDAYMNFPSGSHSWYSSSFSPGVFKVHYAHPNSAAESATPEGEDHVTKLVVETSRGFYPIGLPDIVSNQAVFISEVVIGGEGLDTPNGYFTGGEEKSVTFVLDVLDWDEVSEDKSELFPVWSGMFTAPGLALGTQTGSVTLAVRSESETFLGVRGLDFSAQWSPDGGDTWTAELPSWLTVSSPTASGVAGEPVPYTVSWDLTPDARIGKALFRLVQDRTGKFIETRISDTYFAGTTASTLTSGTMTVNILDDSGDVVGTATVPVSGGKFGTVLPVLSNGTRYSFEGLPLKTVTSLPDRLREGSGPLDGVFRDCSSLTSVVGWDSRNGTSFEECFKGCSALTASPELNTLSSLSFKGMFEGCSALTSLYLYNTASATDLSRFLCGCSSLSAVPKFNTARVTNFSRAFQDCSSVRSLPLFNMEQALDLSYILAGSGIQEVPYWDTFKVTDISFALANCKSLTGFNRWYCGNVTDATGLFAGCTRLPDPGSLVGLLADLDLSDCSSLSNIYGLSQTLGVVPESYPTPTLTIPKAKSNVGAVKNYVAGIIAMGWNVVYSETGFDWSDWSDWRDYLPGH